MSKRSTRRKSPSRRFRRWRKHWLKVTPPASTLRLLAPGAMVEGYERLVALAVEHLGPQAVVTCQSGLYWVQAFPDTAPDCLGQVEGYAVDRLMDVVAYWNRHWRELDDARSYWDDDSSEWTDWWAENA